MASLFWVGGSTAYDGITNRLATTSGGAASVAAIAAGDTVTFDTNSGSAAVTTSAAISCTTLNFNANFTGSLTMSNNLTVSGTVTHGAGTLSLGSNTVSFGTFNSTAGTRTINLDSATITCTAGGSSWNVTSGGTLTVNTNTATITLSGAASNFNSSTNLDWKGLSVVMTGSGTCQFSGTGFKNITFTGTAATTSVRTISNNVTYSGTLTMGGNTTQGVNRLGIQSTVIGTQRTFSGPAIVISGDVDFQDMALSGSPTWTNAGSAYIGDYLGNDSNITSHNTSPLTLYKVNIGNWSSNTWSTSSGGAAGSRMPLPQDTAILNSNSGTGTTTIDTPRAAATITCVSGYTGTLSNSVGFTVYGSFTLVAGMGWGANSYALSGRSSHTFTSGGLNPGTVNFSAPGGTYTITDDYVATGSLTVNDGTFVGSNRNITCTQFIAQSGRTTVVTVTGSNISLTSTGAVAVVGMNSVNTTLNSSGSTWSITSVSLTARNFIAGGSSNHTFPTVNYTVANSPGALVLGSAGHPFTIGTLNVGSGRTLQLISTVNVSVTNWNVNGVNNGYIYLPGGDAPYLTAPDSAALSVTGDITIDIKAALDDWTPAAISMLVAKFSSGGQGSYEFYVAVNGTLGFVASADGTNNAISVNSSVATGLTDGAAKWLRVTYDVDNGAAGKSVKFYMSDDAVVWTQLGTTQTTAGTSSIFNSTAVLEIGTDLAGSAHLMKGKVYRTVIYSDLTQTTKVFDADFSAKPVGTNSVIDTSTNTAYPTGSYLSLPGVTGQYASTPDTAANSITGDQEILVRVNFTTLTPASTAYFASKWNGTTGGCAWRVGLLSGGSMVWVDSSDGVNPLYNNTFVSAANVSAVISAGTTYWVRITIEVNNAGKRVITAYWAPDSSSIPSSWTQFTGGLLNSLSAANTADSSSPVEIGSIQGGISPLAGKYYRAVLKSGIGGSAVFDASFNQLTQTFVETYGAVVTINGAVAISGTLAKVGDGRVSINASTGASAGTLSKGIVDAQGNVFAFIGTSLTFNSDNWQNNNTASNYAIASDVPSLRITGDLDLRFHGNLASWSAPADEEPLISKWDSAIVSYRLTMRTSGVLRLELSTNGTSATQSIDSTSAVPFADNSDGWVRAAIDVDDGSGNRVTNFYTSTDGTSWSQLGATVTTAGTVTIASNSSRLFIGTYGNTAPALNGKVYEVVIKDGINGTTVASPRFVKTNNSSDYLVIQDSTATGMGVWYAGTNSTNVSNNTGWFFTAPTENFFLLF